MNTKEHIKNILNESDFLFCSNCKYCIDNKKKLFEVTKAIKGHLQQTKRNTHCLYCMNFKDECECLNKTKQDVEETRKQIQKQINKRYKGKSKFFELIENFFIFILLLILIIVTIIGVLYVIESLITNPVSLAILCLTILFIIIWRTK